MSEQLKAHRESLEGCEKRALSKLQATREVVKAARALMLAEPPCHCGELAPGPCCEACRREHALRDALAKLDEAER